MTYFKFSIVPFSQIEKGKKKENLAELYHSLK